MSINRKKGIEEARAGNKPQALEYLKSAVRENPQDATAWLWIASLLDDTEKKRLCYEKVLAVYPENPHAIKGMQVLGLMQAPVEIDPYESPAPPPPSIPQYSPQPQQTYINNQAYHNAQHAPSDSSDTIAMILEIIFGLFGILGIGWLYAGKMSRAAAVFFGYFVVVFIELAVIAATLGVAYCFIAPLNLVIAIISGIKVRDYIRQTGAHGSIVHVILGIVLGLIAICGGISLFFGSLSAAFSQML